MNLRTRLIVCVWTASALLGAENAPDAKAELGNCGTRPSHGQCPSNDDGGGATTTAKVDDDKPRVQAVKTERPDTPTPRQQVVTVTGVQDQTTASRTECKPRASSSTTSCSTCPPKKGPTKRRAPPKELPTSLCPTTFSPSTDRHPDCNPLNDPRFSRRLVTVATLPTGGGYPKAYDPMTRRFMKMTTTNSWLSVVRIKRCAYHLRR